MPYVKVSFMLQIGSIYNKWIVENSIIISAVICLPGEEIGGIFGFVLSVEIAWW